MQQQTLIKSSIKKVLIAERIVPGGLKDISQRYVFNYLVPTEEYTPKIELAIFMIKEGVPQGAYRSLRFDEVFELNEFILDLIKSKVYYEVMRKILKRENNEAMLKELLTNIAKAYSDKFRECYVAR